MKININKILKKTLRFLGSHLNLVILMIFAIIILCAGWLLYDFVYKSVSKMPEVSFEKIEIREVIVDRVMEYIDAREQNILEAMSKNYRDVFK